MNLDGFLNSVGDTCNEKTSNRLPRKSFSPRYTTGALHTVAKKRCCAYCSDEHWSDECQLYPDVESRKKRLRGSCFKCLRRGHSWRDCRGGRECVFCKLKGNHHRSLCPKQFGKQVEEQEPVLKAVESSNVALNEQVVMQTSLAQIFNLDNETINKNARLLFDCGSQRTYISKFMADNLQLKEIGKNYLVVYTFGTSKPSNIETPVVEIGLKLLSGFTLRIKANVVPDITGRIQRTAVNEKIQKRLTTYTLADTIPSKNETSFIDLLVGNDYYADIVSFRRVHISDNLYLLQSKLGWILSGRTKESSRSKNYSAQLLTCLLSTFNEQSLIYKNVDEVIDKKLRLEDFWQLETIGIRDCPVENYDEGALIKFNDTVRFIDGRYFVSWPWRNDEPQLPENYHLAYGRLKSLLKKWRDDPCFMKKYDEIMKDQLKKGIMEIIGVGTVVGVRIHYLPQVV